jgi:organic hydroperoxide reductase OsmC/OhrA
LGTSCARRAATAGCRQIGSGRADDHAGRGICSPAGLKGPVSTESRALETYPYTFFSRYGEKPGTNPEELLGAAHAACFTMSFVRLLAERISD